MKKQTQTERWKLNVNAPEFEAELRVHAHRKTAPVVVQRERGYDVVAVVWPPVVPS
jgi:hypothetical protein